MFHPSQRNTIDTLFSQVFDNLLSFMLQWHAKNSLEVLITLKGIKDKVKIQKHWYKKK